MPTNNSEAKKKTKDIVEDLDDIKEKTSELSATLAESVQTMKDNTEEFLHESVDHVKEKYSDLQAAITDYCKANPLKSVGFAALAGFLAAQLLRK